MKVAWFLGCLNMAFDMALRASSNALHLPMFADPNVDRTLLWLGVPLFVWAAFAVYLPKLRGEP